MACPFGSEPKASSDAWFTYEQADILGAIPTWGAWLTTALLGLPSGPQGTAEFCSVEPVGDLPSGADWVLFFTNPPLAIATGAYGRLRNQIVAWKFAQLCECAADPAGVCVDQTNVSVNLQTNGTIGGSYTFGTKVKILTAGQITGVRYQGSGISNQQITTRTRILKLPSTTVYDGTVSTPQSSGMHTTSITPITTAVNDEFIVYWDNVAGGENLYYSHPSFPFDVGSVRVEAGVGTTTNGDHSMPTSGGDGNQHWAMLVHCTYEPTTISPPPDIDIPSDYPTPPDAPTCTTDQDICDAIYELRQAVTSLLGQVQLIRFLIAPSGMNPGDVNSGLTGTGQLTVSAILGVEVHLTAVPSGWGRTGDTPPRLIPKVGSVQFGDGTSWQDEVQLHYERQLVLEAPALTTKVRYSLRPGVTATITELQLSEV